MPDQLIIFDTTMRDGEQSPGAAMTKDEKVRIGKQLERLRVDVIEAGFAASSPGDFEAIRAVAAAVKDSTVCSLARANDNDVKRAGEAVKGANRGRVHTFIATSPIHMKHKLRMEPDAVLEAATAILPKIGPWPDKRLPPPEKGNVRLNLLTPIGLCFGEGPFAAIARDPVGGPLVKAGAVLVHALQQQPKATVN